MWLSPCPPVDLTFNVQILVTGRPYVKNIRVCHEDDEAALDAGQVFGTRFKQLMSKFGVIRFLDWQYSNTTNLSKWSERKPVDYYSYNPNHFPRALMAGMTTSVGDAYSATLSGFSLVDKAKVIVRFDHDQTTDHGTLNVNGTGAKALADPNGYVRTSTVSGYVWGQNQREPPPGPGQTPLTPAARMIKVSTCGSSTTIRTAIMASTRAFLLKCVCSFAPKSEPTLGSALPIWHVTAARDSFRPYQII